MVHERQRLALGLETGDYPPGVHSQLDHFESHAAAHWLLLLGHINHAITAFADLLEQFVAPDPIAGLLRRRHQGCVLRLGGQAQAHSDQAFWAKPLRCVARQPCSALFAYFGFSHHRKLFASLHQTYMAARNAISCGLSCYTLQSECKKNRRLA